MARVLFITGTDTGVGKTLVTCLLLEHARARKMRALAMKPFCSGGRDDIELIQSLQPGEISDNEVNPFYFEEPIAPFVAAKKNKRAITLTETLERIRAVQRRCEILFIEGSGGLLVPLGKSFLVLDMIRRLQCKVVVVGRNRLGTINHSMLTISELQRAGIKDITIVISDGENGDVSSATNEMVIRKWAVGCAVMRVPFLGKKVLKPAGIKESAKKIKKLLARIVGPD